MVSTTIPAIAQVAFGESVNHLIVNRETVLELLNSAEPRVRAGAVSLLATQFSTPQDEIASLLRDFIGNENSSEPRSVARRYLLEIESTAPLGRFHDHVKQITDQDASESFVQADQDLKVAILRFSLDSKCQWSESTKRRIVELALNHDDIDVQLAGISAAANPFYRTGHRKSAGRFAAIALDERVEDKVRVLAAMSVYHIIRPQVVEVSDPDFPEYQRRENEYLERVGLVVKQRSSGIDRELMISLVEVI